MLTLWTFRNLKWMKAEMMKISFRSDFVNHQGQIQSLSGLNLVEQSNHHFNELCKKIKSRGSNFLLTVSIGWKERRLKCAGFSTNNLVPCWNPSEATNPLGIPRHFFNPPIPHTIPILPLQQHKKRLRLSSTSLISACLTYFTYCVECLSWQKQHGLVGFEVH